MKKWYWLGCLFLVILSIIPFVSSFEGQPELVLDARNTHNMPKRFRKTTQVDRDQKSAKTDLSNLYMIGSGQFSVEQLKAILKRIHAPLIIIDLRHEPHGFLNGNAVSWIESHQWFNRYDHLLHPSHVENNLLKQLRRQQIVTVNVVNDNKQNEILEAKAIPIPVEKVQSEQNVAKQFRLQYIRFRAPEQGEPNAKEVDYFIKLVRSIPTGTWIYFHCREGVEPTTTFMMMYDMIKNANHLSFATMVARQHKMVGHDLQQQPNTKHFLKEFYHYCRKNNDGFHTSWSEWLFRARPLRAGSKI